MAATKISVVTITLNSAATIADTLQSVASQTYPHVEHLVIDGNSSDDTLSIVQEHGRSGIHVLSEPDGGIYQAMNKGLRLAQGELVGFLNADDVYQDAEVLTEVARVAQDRRVDAIYGDLVYVSRTNPGRVVRHWHSGRWSRRRLRFGWMPPHPTLYVRKVLADLLGGFDEQLRIAADYDFMLRLLKRPGIHVAYLDRVLVRMRTGGASNRSLAMMWRKSREDLMALQRNHLGGWFTLLCKNVRKLPQFVQGKL
jgi:glycosyltransferase